MRNIVNRSTNWWYSLLRKNENTPSDGMVSSRLKHLLRTRELSFIMEAHNALAAKLAERAGFKAIWASSLTLSATMGLRDANELTWTQVLDLVEPMTDFAQTPILLDADSGYGDFNIFARFAKKAEARGIAGVCIEDKAFPKRNSFAETRHALEDIDNFTAKIRAAKDGQIDPDFCLVARTEALVAGAPMDDALTRASAYEAAGADALFVHSKQSTAVEIQEFTRQWHGSIPLVIAPTTYASTPAADFEAMGVSAIIWANHGLRAATASMEQAYSEIFASRSVAGLEGRITPVQDLLSLTDTEELLKTEQKYALAEQKAR